MTVRYRFGCDLSYKILAPTVFVFNIEAARIGRHVDLEETLTITPEQNRRIHTVPSTQTRYLAINAAPGDLKLRYEAQTTLSVIRADPAGIGETPISDVPLSVLPYLYPSRFVSSDRLAAFAMREFGDLAKGHCRVTAICNWIYDNLEYRRGSSDGETTADESLLMRAGVCRDFAHVGIAFCRALGIPARYVSSYAYGLEPDDFHAVFEAYLAGRWWLFDATRQANLDGLVRIGIGRDAAEIAFATPFGEMTPGPVDVFIEHADGSPEAAGRTSEAISIDDTVEDG